MGNKEQAEFTEVLTVVSIAVAQFTASKLLLRLPPCLGFPGGAGGVETRLESDNLLKELL